MLHKSLVRTFNSKSLSSEIIEIRGSFQPDTFNFHFVFASDFPWFDIKLKLWLSKGTLVSGSLLKCTFRHWPVLCLLFVHYVLSQGPGSAMSIDIWVKILHYCNHRLIWYSFKNLQSSSRALKKSRIIRRSIEISSEEHTDPNSIIEKLDSSSYCRKSFFRKPSLLDMKPKRTKIKSRSSSS